MNLIIIIRKRKKKKKKKKEDNREEAYRSEERGRRDDCGLRLAASPIPYSLFFWRESPDSFPSYDLSFFSQDDAGFLFSIFHPNRDIKTTSFYTLHHKAEISEYLNSLLKDIFNN